MSTHHMLTTMHSHADNCLETLNFKTQEINYSTLLCEQIFLVLQGGNCECS